MSDPATQRFRSPSRRRGSAYVLVLSIAMLVTVLGLGAVAVSRVTTRTVNDGNDWDTAGTLAFSAAEHAISAVNAAAAANPTGWRANYTNGGIAFTASVGRGTISWALKDPVDANLTDDYLESFRIYGIGKCGNATRIYSVLVLPGGSPLPLLKTALHSSGAITLTGNGQAVNGSISSNGNVSLSGTVNGTVEAATTTGNATGVTVVTSAPAKTMPSTTLFNDIAASATAINYSSLSSGKLQNCLLSATSNPFGTVNPSGIYLINLAGNNALTITNCRIVGTLMILGANKNTVNIQGPNEMEPGAAGNAILMMSGQQMSTTISGNTTWLSEASAGVNFNPASTPYSGSSNSTTTDDFPPQYRGIIYFSGDSSSSLTINSNAYFVGTVIATCPVKTANQTTFIQDPSIYANPPLGYAVGDAMVEVPGSWRWDTLP